jgi:hypothetical protein
MCDTLKNVAGDTLKNLAEAIQDQNVAWMDGTVPAPTSMTTLFVKDHHQVVFPFPSNEELKAVYDIAQPAAFGKGQETVVDTTYRSGRTLITDDFAINLRPDQALLHQIKSLMIDTDDENAFVRADLYRVNIYGPGDFFKVHKDTPQSGSGHFGSLVFCLPTRFEGGTFVLRNTRGEELKFDWASPSEDQAVSTTAVPGHADVAYIAFASDLDHWVEPITSGYRVTVTFHLFLENLAADRLVQPVLQQLKYSDALAAAKALHAKSALSGTTILFPLVHAYSARNGNNVVLKGGDASLFQCLKQLGVCPKVMFYYDHYHDYDYDHEREGGCERYHLTETVDFYTQEGLYEGESAIDALARPFEVLWARQPTSRKQLLSVGGHYGNEASIGEYYGNACIVTSW